MLQESHPIARARGLAAAALLLLSWAAAPLRAQSNDAKFPTPVFTNEVAGRIAPRDVGDPRRTRHFYLFRGTEGDLAVTLETSELIGDVDVFTATTLRPLVKFTLFGDAARLTKSFYLRREETLVLRVEARAFGDAEGTYRVSFGGSFAPAPAELANAPEPPTPTLPAPETRAGNTRRVTATGARIEEPRPEPTPAEEAEAAAARPAPTPSPERPAGRRGAASRRGRAARPGPSRTRTDTGAGQPSPTRAETAGTESPEETAGAAGRTPEATTAPRAGANPRRRAPRPPRGRATRAGGETATQPRPENRGEPGAAEPPPAPAQRLIIVTKDGETLERDMSAVRRVTVENGQLVVHTRDGRVIRRPMTSVLRMSIEP